MTEDERFQLVERLFHAALAIPAAERQRFLVEECKDDEDLRDEVGRLLAADNPIAAIQEVSISATLPRFGAFQAERVLGRGGMGLVFLARRRDGHFDQLVAVKVISRDSGYDADHQGFLRERRILASLHHPGIAQVIDGGLSSEGPYLVMEYVDGSPLDEYCNDHRLGIPERLAFIRQVCEAVSHAHRNLVIHRDLKPSNVLVTKDGHVKLVDFGTAKFIAVVDSRVTQNLATPRYASPEQLRGQPVGTPTDVYALGIVLFELLSGAWPFGDAKSRLDTARRAVEDVSPATLPLAATAGQAAFCRKTLVQLQRTLAGDISDIVGKALEQDPERRYRSVDELSEDIGRYLAGEPVRARAQSFWYRTRCFARRRFWYLTAAGLSATALLAATVVSYGYARRAQQESERAQRIARFTTETLLSPSPTWNTPMSGHAGPITIEDLLDNAANRAEKDLASDPAAEAQILGTLGASWALLGKSDKAMPQFEAALALMPRDTPGLENERARLFEYACNAASLQGDYARAAALCTDGLAELVKAREPNKDQLFSLPFDLAYMKAKEGAAPGDVERLYRQSADAAALHFGKSDLRFDIAMTRVGIARFDAGDLDSARQILENVVSGMRSLPGPPVELVIAERALAPVYRVQGSFALAEEHARQALMLLEKRPASFIDRYLIELEMFLDRALQGQADSAVGESESVVTAVLSKLPQGHIDRTRPSLMSGRILTLAMRCRDAEPRLREALLIYRTRLPLWPVMQAESLAALAECLACQGREGEAQQAAGEALRLYREAFGPRASGHPSVTAVKAVLGASAVR